MPFIPGPPVRDQARFLGVVAQIDSAQAGRGVADRFRQCRRGIDGDWSGIDRDGHDLAVHEYDGPSGRGYEIECLWTDPDTAEHWRRVVHRGPETWRERGWYVVPDGEPV